MHAGQRALCLQGVRGRNPGGRSISDFVLANDANSAANAAGNPAAPHRGRLAVNSAGPANAAIDQGPTNFSGSTTDQIVKVTQSGTGAGNCLGQHQRHLWTGHWQHRQCLRRAGRGHRYRRRGLLGNANNPVGGTFGIKGSSASTSGTGMRGLASASRQHDWCQLTGQQSQRYCRGVQQRRRRQVSFQRAENAVEKFSVDGAGNV